MTDEGQEEQQTISVEDAIRILQIENGDRLAYLKIFQGYAAGIESLNADLKREIAQYNASVAARTPVQPSVIPSEEEESDEEASDDADE